MGNDHINQHTRGVDDPIQAVIHRLSTSIVGKCLYHVYGRIKAYIPSLDMKMFFL